MSSVNAREHERLLELMADEASAGLDDPERLELESLHGRSSGVNRDELMATAALVQVSCLRRDGGTAMPSALRSRLAAQADLMLASAGPDERRAAPVARLDEARARRQSTAPDPAAPAPGPVPARDVRRGPSLAAWTGWAAAAALAVALVLPRGPVPTGTPEPAPPAPMAAADARSALLAGAPDALTLPWTPPTAPGFENVRGDVVWSDARQAGYLRLTGMPVNDPAQAQYQLWIVDAERDKHPVDGGVFDVSRSGEVIIPIQAKLPVTGPEAFAITREQPGGVVVSAGPLLVVAAPG